MCDEPAYEGDPIANAVAALEAENERLRVLLVQSKRYVEHSYHEFREPDERELLAAIDAALH
jgi:hypothetical protein